MPTLCGRMAGRCRARTLTELKGDADAAADIETYLIALIPFEPAALRPAAE